MNTTLDAIADALGFLRAGGTFSRQEWEALSVEEKAAHVEAGRQIESEQAIRTAVAVTRLEAFLQGGGRELAHVVQDLSAALKRMETR